MLAYICSHDIDGISQKFYLLYFTVEGYLMKYISARLCLLFLFLYPRPGSHPGLIEWGI